MFYNVIDNTFEFLTYFHFFIVQKLPFYVKYQIFEYTKNKTKGKYIIMPFVRTSNVVPAFVSLVLQYKIKHDLTKPTTMLDTKH